MTLALIVLVILNLKDHPWQKSASAVVPAVQATVTSVPGQTAVSAPASPAANTPQAVAANSAPAANPRVWQSTHDPFWPKSQTPLTVESAPKPIQVKAPPPATQAQVTVRQPYKVLGRLRGTDDEDAIYLRNGNDLVQVEENMTHDEKPWGQVITSYLSPAPTVGGW